MSFIRTKKIKGKKYAYIVENKWKKKKVKQRFKKYLGRVYEFKREEKDFEEFISVGLEEYRNTRKINDIILDLAEWEVLNHGFEKKDNVYVNGECAVNLKKKQVVNTRNSNVSLAFNEGMLNEYAIKKLLRLRFKGEDEEEDAYLLAKSFVESGIKVPKQIFVEVFSKLYK